MEHRFRAQVSLTFRVSTISNFETSHCLLAEPLVHLSGNVNVNSRVGLINNVNKERNRAIYNKGVIQSSVQLVCILSS